MRGEVRPGASTRVRLMRSGAVRGTWTEDQVLLQRDPLTLCPLKLDGFSIPPPSPFSLPDPMLFLLPLSCHPSLSLLSRSLSLSLPLPVLNRLSLCARSNLPPAATADISYTFLLQPICARHYTHVAPLLQQRCNIPPCSPRMERQPASRPSPNPKSLTFR
jgi:hypothetical protein